MKSDCGTRKKTMRTLVLDFETTGVPAKGCSLTDPSQPHIVQLAAVLFDADARKVSSVSLVVHPGIEIPAGATGVHGISTEQAWTYGIPEKGAVGLLSRLTKIATHVVTHNASFDETIFEIAAARFGIIDCGDPVWRCTMTKAAPIVNLPPTEKMRAAGFNRPKSPKLDECARFFFDEEHMGAHDALADASMCGRIYFELLARGAWS